jgi:hypothetical protein
VKYNSRVCGRASHLEMAPFVSPWPLYLWAVTGAVGHTSVSTMSAVKKPAEVDIALSWKSASQLSVAFMFSCTVDPKI